MATATKTKKPRKSIAEMQEEMTRPILESLEAAIQAAENGEKMAGWLRPWRSAGAGMVGRSISLKNDDAGRPYSGWNAIATAFILETNGWETPLFGTFKQWKTAGAVVRKGERGFRLAYPLFGKREEEQPDGSTKEVSFIRGYREMVVFNIAQTHPLGDAEGSTADVLPELLRVFLPKPREDAVEFDPIETAETVIRQYADAPRTEHGGARACYNPTTDRIQMPNREDFDSPAHYYTTRFHEMAHSTGHESRLNRILPRFRFGDHGYSAEELCAEMAAEMLAGHCGIEGETRENAIAYLRGWHRKVKESPDILMAASTAAFVAVRWILGDRAGIKKQGKPGIGKERGGTAEAA